MVDRTDVWKRRRAEETVRRYDPADIRRLPVREKLKRPSVTELKTGGKV